VWRAFDLKENYLLILLTMSELCSSQDWKAQLKLPAADTRFKTEVCETESKSFLRDLAGMIVSKAS
jgi:hypothetical protein